MKYCPFCGKENADDSKFCVSCGATIGVVEPKQETTQGTNPDNNANNNPNVEYITPNNKPAKQSTLNLVSMILGIVSVSTLIVCCCGGLGFISIIPGVLAIIFSAIYLKKNGNEDKAIAGLILGIIGVVLSIIIMISAPSFMEEFKRQLVEQCNNGQLDQDVCEEYRKMFPSWFEFYFIH